MYFFGLIKSMDFFRLEKKLIDLIDEIDVD